MAGQAVRCAALSLQSWAVRHANTHYASSCMSITLGQAHAVLLFQLSDNHGCSSIAINTGMPGYLTLWSLLQGWYHMERYTRRDYHFAATCNCSATHVCGGALSTTRVESWARTGEPASPRADALDLSGPSDGSPQTVHLHAGHHAGSNLHPAVSA